MFCASTSLSFSTCWSKTTDFTMPPSSRRNSQINTHTRCVSGKKKTPFFPTVFCRHFLPLYTFRTFISLFLFCLSFPFLTASACPIAIPKPLTSYFLFTVFNVPQNVPLKGRITINTVVSYVYWTAHHLTS